MEVRQEVKSFAKMMEAVLRLNDDSKGEQGWKETSIGYLTGKLSFEETRELEQELTKKLINEADNDLKILKEMADVGNMMMIADNLDCEAFSMDSPESLKAYMEDKLELAQ